MEPVVKGTWIDDVVGCLRRPCKAFMEIRTKCAPQGSDGEEVDEATNLSCVCRKETFDSVVS